MTFDPNSNPYRPGPQAPASGSALPGANAAQAFARYWRKYADFSGRASRSEYWWVSLILFVLNIVAAALPALSVLIALGPDGRSSTIPPLTVVALVITGAWLLATIVPGLALLARRLHDANFSGWFILLTFVPFGGFVVFVFTLLGPNPAGARFDRPAA